MSVAYLQYEDRYYRQFNDCMSPSGCSFVTNRLRNIKLEASKTGFKCCRKLCYLLLSFLALSHMNEEAKFPQKHTTGFTMILAHQGTYRILSMQHLED